MKSVGTGETRRILGAHPMILHGVWCPRCGRSWTWTVGDARRVSAVVSGLADCERCLAEHPEPRVSRWSLAWQHAAAWLRLKVTGKRWALTPPQAPL